MHSNVWADIRYALRAGRKNPAMVLAAIGTLALGIGAVACIFSILSGVLLRPLPFADPGRLVQLTEFDARNAPGASYYGDLQNFRLHGKSFQEIVIYGNTSKSLLDVPDPERIQTVWAERNLFRTLGTTPLLGRTFNANDALDVVVVSEGLWKRRFGGDPACIGRKITLDGDPFTIVGVMPESFQFPYRTSRTEAWIPWEMPANRAGSPNSRVDSVVARMNPRVTLAAARQESNAMAAPGDGVVVIPVAEAVAGSVRPALLTLLGAVGVVLFIACANVANLLLARAARRSHEIAVRAALGAGRWRLVRQLLTESLLLSLAGGIAGLLIGTGGTRLVLNLAASQIPRSWEIGLDWRVFGFLLAASVATGIAFGILPALTASRISHDTALKLSIDRASGGSGSAGWSGRRLRDGLVIAEVSLSALLLVCAGLLLRGFLRLQESPVGLVPDHVLTLRLTANLRDYPARGSFGRYLHDLEDEVRRVPGVRSVGFVQYLPLQNWGWAAYFSIEGRPDPPGGPANLTELRYVTPGYFETLGIPVRSGRPLSDGDTADTPTAILVNETLARRYFPGEDPVGRHTDRGTIVGVVGDVHTSRLDRPPNPEIYYSFVQNAAATTDAGVSLVIRTHARPESAVKEITSAIHQVNPRQVVYDPKSMNRVIANSLAGVQLYLWLLGVFALLALLLALSGVYAVISYVVASRTQEFGIRLALGAEAAQILRLVLVRCSGLVMVGIAIGLAGAMAAARLLNSLMSGVTSADPATLVGVAVLLMLVALAAAIAPARRAMRVDPVTALRG